MSKLLPLSAELLSKTVDGLILSGPLVLPTLDGRKIVTRRLARKWLKLKAGDLLFVRENWRLLAWDLMIRSDCAIEYAADQVERSVYLDDYAWAKRETRRVTAWRREHGHPHARTAPLRPSLLLPRWASRCVLRLTEDPRLERVQDIDDEDAQREGVEETTFIPDDGFPPSLGYAFGAGDGKCMLYQTRVLAFEKKWEEIHTKPGERWEDNPEIVRLAFERIA